MNSSQSKNNISSKDFTGVIENFKRKLRGIWRTSMLKIRHFYEKPEVRLRKRNAKTIIICINGWVPHGAWTDRLKGIISAYDFAKERGFQFKIWYDTPTDLSRVLVPNQINWQCSKDDLRYNPLFDKVIYLVDNLKGLESVELSQNVKKKYFIYLNIDTVKDQNRWKGHFNSLFKFDIKVKEIANSYLTDTYINVALVFRFIDLFGDYKIKGRNPKQIDKEGLATEYLEKFDYYFNSVDSSEKPTQYYIFSDSDFFTLRLKKMCPHFIVLHDSDRKFITNASLTETTGLNALKRTASDFYFLSKCNEIIHFVDNKHLYPSGFPLYASYLEDKEIYQIVSL